MNPKKPFFRPLDLADRPRFDAMLNAYPTQCSHYNFAALYCWQEEYHTTWQIAGKHLYIHNGLSDLLLMPLGPQLSAKDLISLSRSMREQGYSGCIGLVPPQFPTLFPQLGDHFNFIRDDANADYIYASSRLALLEGRKLAGKRNHINRFVEIHPDYSCRELDAEEWPRCNELASIWSRRQLKLPLIESPESQALRLAMIHCRQLSLRGYGLFIDRQLTAFVIWSRQRYDTATIHFEKFDPGIKGASQMINRESARFLSSWAVWINREQDLGIPGLRRAKRSYLPDHMISGFTAVPK